MFNCTSLFVWMTNFNSKTALLIIAVIITSSTEHITIPIMVTYFSSLYFIIMMSSIHGCINFGLLMLIITKCRPTKSEPSLIKPKKWHLIMLAGSLNAVMSICFIYTANPERTPVVLQSILLGLAVFPSVLWRKCILNKIIHYDKLKITIASVLLIISVGVAIIPLTSHTYDLTKSYWIIGYVTAVILLSMDSTLQEKYIGETD